MKNLFLHFMIVLLVSSCCEVFDNCSDNCEGTIGKESLTYEYFNQAGPTISAQPTSVDGNIQFEAALAVPVQNGVNIVIPGVRVRTNDHNYEIVRFKIDERQSDEECFISQSEFGSGASSFLTKIASVLVLDMSTSLSENIDNLKAYAKEYARTVVNSSANSIVAVVFFSDRDAILETGFYNSENISQLHEIIDGFSDYQERTALFQATKLGIDKLIALNFDGEKSLVAFTDGGDNDSNNPEALINQIKSSGIDRFAIGLRGKDFQESKLRDIVTSNSNFLVAENVDDLEKLFRTIGRGVISVYQLVYTRSDQTLLPEETIEIRISMETEKIE